MDARENSKKKQLAPPKLKLLFTIVNREKTELFTALIQGFDVNMQLSAAARGTATQEIMQMLGLSDKSKSVIMSVIREDTEDTLLRFLDVGSNGFRHAKRTAFSSVHCGPLFLQTGTRPEHSQRGRNQPALGSQR